MRLTSIRRAAALALLITGSACAESRTPADAPDSRGEAFPGAALGAKQDAFGRSLVGAPSPMPADPRFVNDQAGADDALRRDLRARRAYGWELARRVLEPVALLGLVDRAERRAACPEGTNERVLERTCSSQGVDSCASRPLEGGEAACAWNEASGQCEPACDGLEGAADSGESPSIPRWQTWYGIEEIDAIFGEALASQTDAERLASAPLSDDAILAAMRSTHDAADRSRRWPLWRYVRAVDELFDCSALDRFGLSEEDRELECAALRQSQFSGAAAPGHGIARITYSPSAAAHALRNHAEVIACPDQALTDTWCGPGEACDDPPENFSRCFSAEFPSANPDPSDPLVHAGPATLIKATWSRVGLGFELPGYHTDASSLDARLAPGAEAEWNERGDEVYSPTLAFPTNRDIYTIRTRDDALYRLTGLHIMSKEPRHWAWVSLWWSDEPDADFGADRPASFAELDPAWSNYKMCVVTDYIESDPDPLARFDDLPSLRDALAATGTAPGAPTWCSNPYIERGPGNARTNCIGCHQHAGTRWIEQPSGELEAFPLQDVIALATSAEFNRFPENGRTRVRSHFAADYSWAFSRMDDVTELFRAEVERSGVRDEAWRRRRAILTEPASAERGAELWARTSDDLACADCHGADGRGDLGPDLSASFASRTEWRLLHTILEGRGSMPAWGESLSDQELGDLFAYLRQTHAPE